MDKILLTGGSGFIGKNILQIVKDENKWFAPTSSKLDICNEEQVCHYILKNKISKIVHAAVFTHPTERAEEKFYHNVQMTMNIHKASRMVERVIILGSGAEYAKEFDIVDAKEEEIGIHIPTSVYGLSKYLQHTLTSTMDNCYNLRLFGVYGPYENWKSCFISNICCKAIYDLDLTIRQNCRFSYLPVVELVLCIQQMLQAPNPKYHDYNIAPKESITLLEIATMVNEIAGKKLPIQLLKEGYNKEYTANGQRFQKEFSPYFRDYKTGITELYQWYREHKNEIDFSVLKDTK